MPIAPPTPCRKPGCRATSHTPYCPEHTEEAERQADLVRQRYDDRRGNSAARGYGHKWRTSTRPRILRRDPVCKCRAASCHPSDGPRCTFPSTDVDHVIPRPRGSDGDENLQGLCHECHAHKTATEDGGYGHASTPP
jgi:5-methylcytosine-specific restriction protein A